MPSSRPASAFLCLVAVASFALLGCTQPEPEPSHTPPPTSSAPEATSEPTPELPEPVFDGTAEQNQAYFDLINQQLIDEGSVEGGASFIDNLVDHGYPRANMEVTPDVTSIGRAADNIVFSIRFGDGCLLGQWGNIGYTSLVTEVLSTGRCIVGTAHPA